MSILTKLVGSILIVVAVMTGFYLYKPAEPTQEGAKQQASSSIGQVPPTYRESGQEALLLTNIDQMRDNSEIIALIHVDSISLSYPDAVTQGNTRYTPYLVTTRILRNIKNPGGSTILVIAAGNRSELLERTPPLVSDNPSKFKPGNDYLVFLRKGLEGYYILVSTQGIFEARDSHLIPTRPGPVSDQIARVGMRGLSEVLHLPLAPQ